MNTLIFQVPPFPTFIAGSKDCFKKGKKHIKRTFSVFDLLIVKSGLMYMSENGVNYEVSEGEYIILTPGFEHFGYRAYEKETEYYWLHFELENEFELKSMTDINWGMIVKKERTCIEAAKYLLHIPTYGKFMNKEYIYHELHQLLYEMNTPEKRLKEQIIFQQLILYLQTESVRIPTSAEEVSKQTIAYIQEHYSDETMKMDKISKQLLFHSDYITRCLQKTLGVTPIQYLTTYRFSIAKQLLATTNIKLEAISKQVGIQDNTYFSRLFKKVEGITPIEYRRIANREGK